MNVDLEKLWGWHGGLFRASGAITHGPDFSPHYLGNILLVTNIEIPRPVTRIFELWYEQNAFNNRFSMRAGLMLADTEFATSETAFTFMNSTLGWMAWLANDLPFGGPAYPLSTPGARIRSSRSTMSTSRPRYSAAIRPAATAPIKAEPFPQAPFSAFAAASS